MHRSVPIFDQRGQAVTYQYNAAGNINVESVRDKADLVHQMTLLRDEADKAANSGILTNDQSIDFRYNIEKSGNELGTANPKKESVISYLSKAKDIVNGVSAAVNLTEAINHCVEKIQHII